MRARWRAERFRACHSSPNTRQPGTHDPAAVLRTRAYTLSMLFQPSIDICIFTGLQEIDSLPVARPRGSVAQPFSVTAEMNVSKVGPMRLTGRGSRRSQGGRVVKSTEAKGINPLIIRNTLALMEVCDR